MFNTFGQNLETNDAVLAMTKHKYQIKTLFMICLFLSKKKTLIIIIIIISKEHV